MIAAPLALLAILLPGDFGGLGGLVAVVILAVAAYRGWGSPLRRAALEWRDTRREAAPDSDLHFYVQRLGRSEGPYSAAAVHQMLRTGEITNETALRRADGGEPFQAWEVSRLPGGNSAPATLGGWAFVVFFFGWVGGVVGYLMLQNENLDRAKHVLKWGLIWTGIWLAVTIATYVLAFVVISSM